MTDRPHLFTGNSSPQATYVPVRGGIDEVGRGSLFGPLLIGGVANPYGYANSGVRDSKYYPNHKQRKLIADVMRPHVVWALQPMTAAQINAYGMAACLQAGARHVQILLVKTLAIMGLGPFHLEIIADGDDFEEKDVEGQVWAQSSYLNYRITSINQVKADETVFECSAASVLAKVHRDEEMVEMSKRPGHWPYGLDTNSGYGTPNHGKALHEYGLLPDHRKSFVQTFMTNWCEKHKLGMDQRFLFTEQRHDPAGLG